MEVESNIIERCLANDITAQKKLYDHFSGRMYGLCLRLAKNQTDAEDILQEGFIKVFAKLKDFRHEGSFEGWIRRIIVTTSINFYKRKNLFNKDVDVEDYNMTRLGSETAIDMMSVDEIQQLIKELPHGYRTVFHLSSVEGYTHKEIGDMLNISPNTSKSQLTRAKMSLQKKLSRLLQVEEEAISYQHCMAV